MKYHSTKSEYFGITLLLDSYSISHDITKYGQIWSRFAVRFFFFFFFLGGGGHPVLLLPCSPFKLESISIPL